MKKFIKNLKFNQVIDFIFINLLMFLIFFIWIRFLSHNLLISIILSLIFLVLFNFLKSSIFFLKKSKSIITKNLANDIEQYMLTFLSNCNEENLIFFKNLFSSNKIQCNKINNFLILSEKETIICPMFEHKDLQVEQALKALNNCEKLNEKKIIFLCVNCDTKSKMFLEKLKIKKVLVYDKNQIFLQLLKPFNYYPKIKFECNENKKLKFKQLIDVSFNKKRTKGYFLSGILIFFCSFIVKYNFYYVFMSSILFLFALLCFIKKDNYNQIENIFN